MPLKPLAAGLVLAATIMFSACAPRAAETDKPPSESAETPAARVGGGTSRLVSRVAAGSAVRVAAEEALAKRSAAFTMDGDADFGFSSTPMRGWGDVDFQERQSSFVLISAGDSTEYVVDGSTVYERHKGEDTWRRTEAGLLGGALTQLETLEPTPLLRILAEFDGTVRSLGAADFEGATVRKYRVGLETDPDDPTGSADDIFSTMGSDFEETLEVWLDEDESIAKLWYRMSFDMSFVLDDEDEDKDDSYSMEYSIEYEFSDWGKSVAIEVPDESEVDDSSDFDLSDLGEIPETSWPSSVPCGSGTRFDGCLQADPALASGSDCSAPGLRLCLQPVGGVPAGQIRDLVEHFDVEYGVRIEVLPAIDVPAAALDQRDNRASTKALIAEVEQEYAHLDADLEASFMVITPIDVWSENSPEYPWVFGTQWVDHQDEDHYRWSVFSTFRMNPETYGERADPAKWEKRVQTFMTKYVGTSYFQFEMTNDPKSPLYRSITGLSVLDKITQGLPPLDTAPRR